jgi:hypothetical protein
MVTTRCGAELPDGWLCRAFPIRDSACCFWHTPDGRRTRPRPAAWAACAGGASGPCLARTTCALLQPQRVDRGERARVLIAAALAATKLLETGELAARLAVLEAAVRASGATLEPVFPDGEP